MTLAFVNPSRSFDRHRNAISVVGHDGMFEVPFFVEVAALVKASAKQRSTGLSEETHLSNFDAARKSIHDVAREAYSHRRQTSYTLTVSDFR